MTVTPTPISEVRPGMTVRFYPQYADRDEECVLMTEPDKKGVYWLVFQIPPNGSRWGMRVFPGRKTKLNVINAATDT